MLELSWGVTCVDSRSCRLSNSIQETFGCQDVSYRAGRDCPFGDPGTIYNNSSSPQLVPGFFDSHHSFQVVDTSSAVLETQLSQVTQFMTEFSGSEDENIEAEDGQEDPGGTAVTILGAVNLQNFHVLY